MKNKLKKRRSLHGFQKTFLLLLLTFFSGFLLSELTISAGSYQQQRRISGTVTEENGKPLPGATILIEGTTIGTNSDQNGKYSLEITNENALSVISFMAYKT